MTAALLTGIILFANLFFFGIVLYNFIMAPKIDKYSPAPAGNQRLSVCIPARNEENNIRECLRLILNQSYNNIEVLVFDDQSDDNTGIIVSEIEKVDPRVRLIKGSPLPEGWLGKNWACRQMAESAKGEILLFVDADVRLDANAISAAMQLFRQRNVIMLTAFPTQHIRGCGAWLVVPSMNWLLLTFLPLKYIYSSSTKSFVAANGQFILFDKSYYFKIGGHAKIKDKVVEDMEMARIIKSRGDKMITALGHNSIFCEMYSSFKDAFDGFSKNFYPGFNINPYSFMLILLFIQFIFLVPTMLWFFCPGLIYAILLIVISRILISNMSKQNPILNILLHPLQILIILFIGINSIMVIHGGKARWKGRNI